MAESKGLKMATATKADIKNLYTLYNVLENLKKYGASSIEDFDHFDEEEKRWISNIFEEEEISAEGLINYLSGLTNGFHRVVMGYEVLFSNCADPDCDHLEFNNDIKDAIKLWNRIEADLKQGKTVIISPDSEIGKQILDSSKKDTSHD